ncbi:hypothetical protein OENI_260026 [Oenococcus oeni]|nr:hypothetical protein OENI_260026 [Oenococcus oeni]
MNAKFLAITIIVENKHPTKKMTNFANNDAFKYPIDIKIEEISTINLLLVLLNSNAPIVFIMNFV